MIRKRLHLLVLLASFFLAGPLLAQDFSLKELPISVAYYGENLIHPGLKIGTSYTLRSKTKYKQYRSKRKQSKYGDRGKRRELFADLNLGVYSHPNNHTGVFGNIGASYLRTKLRKNWQFGISLELGFLGRVNKFKTYALESGNAFETIPLAGNGAFMVSMAPMFGKEFMLSGKPVRLFLKPWAQLVQYTHSWAPNFNLEVGMVFNIHRNQEGKQ